MIKPTSITKVGNFVQYFFAGNTEPLDVYKNGELYLSNQSSSSIYITDWEGDIYSFVKSSDKTFLKGEMKNIYRIISNTLTISFREIPDAISYQIKEYRNNHWNIVKLIYPQNKGYISYKIEKETGAYIFRIDYINSNGILIEGEELPVNHISFPSIPEISEINYDEENEKLIIKG